MALVARSVVIVIAYITIVSTPTYFKLEERRETPLGLNRFLLSLRG